MRKIPKFLIVRHSNEVCKFLFSYEKTRNWVWRNSQFLFASYVFDNFNKRRLQNMTNHHIYQRMLFCSLICLLKWTRFNLGYIDHNNPKACVSGSNHGTWYVSLLDGVLQSRIWCQHVVGTRRRTFYMSCLSKTSVFWQISCWISTLEKNNLSESCRT